MDHLKKIFLVIVMFSLLAGCIPPPPPQNIDNVCDIFAEYKNWYWITKKTQREWGVPIHVQMAIIHQESKFNAKAKPNREKFLFVIPWKRPSSAYGYSQALKGTWANYQKNSGKYRTRRDQFSDATDFIGWYAYQAYRKAHIERDDTYNLYLAYHEGITGYLKKTYLQKPWLITVAHKVSARADKYERQLSVCEKRFKKEWWNFL
jgi:hypothetical protein